MAKTAIAPSVLIRTGTRMINTLNLISMDGDGRGDGFCNRGTAFLDAGDLSAYSAQLVAFGCGADAG